MATAGWNAFIPDLSDVGEDDDGIPTVVWEDSATPRSGVRSVTRTDRGPLPSDRGSPGSTTAGAEVGPPHRDALVPGNVFLLPPRSTDPPPPWKRLLVRRARDKTTFVIEPRRPRTIARTQPSLLPHVTFALAAAILVGLCYDVQTRHRLAVDAGHAARTASAFVAAVAHR